MKHIETKSYAVHIFGADYKIVSDEPESHLMQAAADVDTLMKEIAAGAGTVDKYKIAVLAALQMASLAIYRHHDVATAKKHEDALKARLENLMTSLSV